MYLQPNTLLQGGKYKIVRHISSGGFGNTYEGELTLLHYRVAIKEFLVKDFCNRDAQTSHVTVGTQSKAALVEKLRKKFLEEAATLFSIHHEHIIRVTDIFEENGTAYYVMDFIEGESLQQMLKRRGPLPEELALKYIRQVAEALDYIHSQNRLHLDVKPGNIMVTRQDNAILIDFGASKHYDDECGENTSTLMGVNTKGYAPIEQTTQSFTSFSPATDIYALGATLYKLLTGVTPPDANLLMAEEQTLQPLPSGISASTREAVKRSIASNKAQRKKWWVILIGVLLVVGIIGAVMFGLNKPSITIEYAADTASHNVAELTINANGVSYKMINVEGGTFTMGATSEQGSDAESDEKPAHSVTLSSYYIGQTEVTQALWKAVMGSNPSCHKGGNLPVENVSWYDCQEFIRKLNQFTGKTFRLPTEAEWEYAARGGNKSRGYKYAGSNTISDVAWYEGNSNNETHSVASKNANELGLYDMSGNVFEWCQDWYGDYSSGSQTNPTGPISWPRLSEPVRVYRGGCVSIIATDCRSSNRSLGDPSDRFDGLGFRLALSE